MTVAVPITPIVTALLGAGMTPAGVSSAGSGSSATTTAPVPFVILPNEVTGATQTARYIDQATGQYAIDAQGGSFGMNAVQQLVQIAVMDIDFSSIDVISDGTQSQMQNLVANALAPFAAKGLLQIISVEAGQIGTNAEKAVLKWRDLTSQKLYVTPIGGTST